MKFTCPYFDDIIHFKENEFYSVVIEHKPTFRSMLEDIYFQAEYNYEGKCILSINEKIISIHKNCNLISSFAPFEINQKNLISYIISELQATAADEGFFLKTQSLLADIEKHISDLSFNLPCDIYCSKLNFSSLLKSVGIEIADSNGETTEKIFDYINLMTDLANTKLFITVNMRSFFDDDDMQQFCNTAIEHKIPLLMLETYSHPLLKNESRITIDKDLCIF